MYPSPRGWKLIITLQVMQALTLGAVVLRLYSRAFILRNFGIDDVLCLSAMVSAILQTSAMNIQAVNGLGYHIEDVAKDPEHLTRIFKAFFATLILYNIALTCTKAAVIFQCMRFISSRKQRISCWIALALVAGIGTAYIFDSIFICTPINFFWDQSILGGHCSNMQLTWMVNAAFDIVSDIMIIILPLPALWSLNLMGRQKFFLMFIFLIGFLVVIISVIRLYSIHVVGTSKDVTYDNIDAAIWSAIEVQVGIICSCMPAFRPYLKRLFPSLIDSQPRISPGATNAPPTIGQSPVRRFRDILDSLSILRSTRNGTVATQGRNTQYGMPYHNETGSETEMRAAFATVSVKQWLSTETISSNEGKPTEEAGRLDSIDQRLCAEKETV